MVRKIILFALLCGLLTSLMAITTQAMATHNGISLCPDEYRFSAQQYQWDTPTLFHGWSEVHFINGGPEDALNVTARIVSAPVNVTVLDGDVTIGDIGQSGGAWSQDSFELIVDTSNPQNPDAKIVWRLEYDDASGSHHVLDDVPKFCGEPVVAGIDIEKFTLVQIVSAGGDLCEIYDKPQVLTMEYTGDGPDATTHSQDSGKVSVAGDPNDASPVRILVTNKGNPSDSKAKIYFDEEVELGEAFQIDSSLPGQDNLGSNTYVYVYDLAGNLLQSVQFHTSCSQPLLIGDQFGSVRLIGFADKNGQGP